LAMEETGGGIRHGRQFKAVSSADPPAAASRRALPIRPFDYDALAQTGSIMGSGGLVVLDERDCVVDIARFFLKFTQTESCGKCTFCRIGTKRMLEILERLCAGDAAVDHRRGLRPPGRGTAAWLACRAWPKQRHRHVIGVNRGS
jgi:NADH-quinone oxidoreductase subunit F